MGKIILLIVLLLGSSAIFAQYNLQSEDVKIIDPTGGFVNWDVPLENDVYINDEYSGITQENYVDWLIPPVDNSTNLQFTPINYIYNKNQQIEWQKQETNQLQIKTSEEYWKSTRKNISTKDDFIERRFKNSRK